MDGGAPGGPSGKRMRAPCQIYLVVHPDSGKALAKPVINIHESVALSLLISRL